jgi:sRNA-binding protein
VRRRIGKLVRRPKYLLALAAEGSVRFNADGSVAGPVSDEHRAAARAALADIAKKAAAVKGVKR